MSNLTPIPPRILTFGEPEATVPLFPAAGPEDEVATLLPPTPVPTPDDYTPRRIPHLGHALLFVAIGGLILLLAQGSFLQLAHTPHPQNITSPLPPKYLVASMAIAYITTLIASFFFFPLVWKRTFAEGIQWNAATARRNLFKLIPLGLVLGWSVQAISSLIPVPKSIPMDDFFRTQSDVWLVTIFGTLLAPLFEEICFRGFLLPAFAIAYDWLSLPRTPAIRELWHSTTRLTTAGLFFSAILTSILFALLHAEQLAHAWAALFVLFCVSLILTLVRVRTQSVACSTLVHACYNLSVFITLFIATGGYRHLERMAR
jgi:uncharacterized protein